MQSPPGIVWDHQPSAFIDGLVDRDILYMDAQMAMESLIHGGLHDQVTHSFDFDGWTVHWHFMPPLALGLRPLNIFTTVEQSGIIRVILIRFADALDGDV